MSIVMAQARPSEGRQKLLLGAIVLLRERGLSGASFGEVVKRTGAPRGSIYHHFPQGKDQLMTEAVELVGSAVAQLIDRAGDDPGVALRSFVEGWRTQLVSSNFRAGCPVVGVAVELGDGDRALRAATARAFGCWSDRLAALLAARGVDPAAADRFATLAVAAIEGAVMLSRSRLDTEPLDVVAIELDELLQRRLEASAQRLDNREE